MDPFSFAIIGAGNIGRVHAQAITDISDARVVVVCNRGEQRGRALAEDCGAHWTPSYEEAVTRPGVDIVSICTPSGTHAEIAVAAARAGRHLLSSGDACRPISSSHATLSSR